MRLPAAATFLFSRVLRSKVALCSFADAHYHPVKPPQAFNNQPQFIAKTTSFEKIKDHARARLLAVTFNSRRELDRNFTSGIHDPRRRGCLYGDSFRPRDARRGRIFALTTTKSRIIDERRDEGSVLEGWTRRRHSLS